MFGRLRGVFGRVVSAVGGAAVGVGVASQSWALGSLTMPTVDYTDFYAGGSLILGVAVTVMLVKKVKGLIS